MILCSQCGKEVAEGQNFCPYCAQPVGATPGSVEGVAGAGVLQPSSSGGFLQESDLEPPSVVPLSSFGQSKGEEQKAQRKMFVVVGAATAILLLAGVLLFATAGGRSVLNYFRPPSGPERLEGALRAGSPEFDQHVGRIILEFEPDNDAITSPRAIGDIIINMTPTIRNFTGRTISGLEVRAAGYDLSGQVVKERTYIVIPKRRPELGPNKTATPELLMEGIKDDTMPASLKIEITGVTFK